MGIINTTTIITNQKKINSMAKRRSTHRFSTEKHITGQWNTRVVLSGNPLLRAVISYCSYKRFHVDKLATVVNSLHFVLDAGCGKGAYSHWFLGKRPSSACIAVDWSEAALHMVEPSGKGTILRVCADVRHLPFRSASIDGLFSIDTLGHIDDCAMALDEFQRVCKVGSPLFLHSECSDYQKMWPDSALIRQLGKDMLARHDGHDFLKSAQELYMLYSRRFRMLSFFNPAGFCGVLLGYPEKYCMVFKEAQWPFMAIAASVFAWIKKAPVLGGAIRLANAWTNHCEVFFGFKGGGSCFAMMKKP
jgi:ubiquinone/menaquinone biosynthesis C-methylase UbiE